MSETAILRALAPIDHARALVLRAFGASARALFRDRGLRVAIYASLSVIVAFAVTCVAPALLLAVGPIVLGVPHLLSDARYLVARQRLHRRSLFWLAICAPVTLVWTSNHVWVGMIACAGAVVIARAGLFRKALVFLVVLALAILGYAFRGVAEIVFAHLHNLIALGIWVAFFRRAAAHANARRAGETNAAPSLLARVARRRHLLVVTLFAAASLVLFLAPISPAFASMFGVSVAEQGGILSPVASALYSPRFALFFAFAQTVHYAIWLRVVPEEDRPRPGIRSFASTLRALRLDLGPYVILGFAALAIFFIAWSFGDLHAARLGYLRLAITHGYLEVAVVALFVLEGTASRSPRSNLDNAVAEETPALNARAAADTSPAPAPAPFAS